MGYTIKPSNDDIEDISFSFTGPMSREKQAVPDKIDFKPSDRSTLGVEWELWLIDPKTRRISQIAPEVIASLRSKNEWIKNHIHKEFLAGMVEIVTGIEKNVPSAVKNLRDTARILQRELDKYGVELMGSSSHPFETARDQDITHTPRYEEMLMRVRNLIQELLICGLHVHVGIEDKQKVIPIMNALMSYTGIFLGLSNSSPVWNSRINGYQSNRTTFYQQIPTFSSGWFLQDWQDYENAAIGLLKTGSVGSIDMLHWDIRPAPHLGTLEVRICDSPTNFGATGGLIAIIHCMVERFSEIYDQEGPNAEQLRPLPLWFVRENKWRAARFGTASRQIINSNGDTMDFKEITEKLIEQLLPTARKLNCETELLSLRTILEKGNSAERITQFVRNRLYGFDEDFATSFTGVEINPALCKGLVDAILEDFN
jgi:carboxylate-amine ligase